MSEPRRIGEGLQRINDIVARNLASAKESDAEVKPSQSAANAPPSQADVAEAAVKSAAPPKRVPPAKRAQHDAMNAVAVQRSSVMEEKPISYYTPELIQCTLPHSERTEPKDEHGKGGGKLSTWVRKNGDYSLIIISGVDGDGKFLGIPYGAFPRLLLAYIITRVKAKPERKIELTSHFGGFLKEIGYTGNLRGNTAAVRHIKDQLQRLLSARITFDYTEGDKQTRGKTSQRNMDIAPNYDLWWDYKTPDQDSLFGSHIEISEAFFNAILANPIPLRTDILKALHKSPLAIDVYMWLSYRLFSMQATQERELYVPFGALHNQFGTGIAEENYRKFRQQIKLAFTKVSALWHHGSGPIPAKSMLHYEFSESGLFLYTSPLLVARGDRLTDQEKAQAILASRQFDRQIIIKARHFSGRWDVDRLQADYFQWLEDKRITPTNPEAHFIDFVKEHVKRNP